MLILVKTDLFIKKIGYKRYIISNNYINNIQKIQLLNQKYKYFIQPFLIK